MFYWRDLADVPEGFGPAVITIGNFDGVHRGHQSVLGQLVAAARERDAAAVVISFEPHPAQVHRLESAPELIMGLQDRVETLADTGIDGVVYRRTEKNRVSLPTSEVSVVARMISQKICMFTAWAMMNRST